MTVGAISAAAGNALLYAWFVTVLVSAVYVAYDAFTNNPELTVMKWGWVLVTLYIGPIGASIYVVSCQGTGSRDARAVRGAALEAVAWIHDSLRGG